MNLWKLLSWQLWGKAPPAAISNFSATVRQNMGFTLNYAFSVPTARVDGSPLTRDQISSFKIYDVFGTNAPAVLFAQNGVPPAGINQVTGGAGLTSQQQPGLHTFYVVATDASGNVSAPSNSVSITVPQATTSPPATIADFTASLTAN